VLRKAVLLLLGANNTRDGSLFAGLQAACMVTQNDKTLALGADEQVEAHVDYYSLLECFLSAAGF